MIEFVPFEAIEDHHLLMLAKSLEAAPEEVRMDGKRLLQDLQLGKCRLFSFAGGCAVFSKVGRRLKLEAWCCDNIFQVMRVLAADMRRLAADWKCDTIETTVFDPRLASAIARIGGRVESLTVVLPVE